MIVKVFACDEYAKQLTEVMREAIVSLIQHSSGIAQDHNYILLLNFLFKIEKQIGFYKFIIEDENQHDNQRTGVVQIDQFDDQGYNPNRKISEIKKKLIDFYDLEEQQ